MELAQYDDKNKVDPSPLNTIKTAINSNIDSIHQTSEINRKKSRLKQFRIMTWNINGIGNKLGENDILDMIKDTDMCVILESKKGPEWDINIPGYICKNFPRKKTVKNGNHYAGGIVVLISQTYKKQVQFHTKSEHIVWATLKAGLFFPDGPLHIGFVYIPPENSSGNDPNTNYFDILYNEIANRKASGHVALCGDFNGRTSNLVGYLKDVNDDEFCFDLISSNNSDMRIKDIHNANIHQTSRLSEDKAVTTYGRQLIETCNNSGLRIANGVSPFDKQTSCFTCYKYNGASVVDYLITDVSAFRILSKFDIKDKRIDSDHRPLYFEFAMLKGKIDLKKDIPKNAFTRYKWDPIYKHSYIDKLNSDQCRIYYEEFLKSMPNDENNTIDITNKFNQFIIEAISKTFKKAKISNKSKFPINPWFDDVCKHLKRIANQARKNKVDLDIQRILDSNFKRTVQLKKRNYHKKLATELDNLNSNNPDDYWRFLKKIKKGTKCNTDLEIEDFTRKYKENSTPPAESEFNYDNMHKIERYINEIDLKSSLQEDSIMNDIINGPIREDEITRALKKTKNGKACGEDGVPSEFYKFTDGVLNKPLMALFDYIMESGKFPSEWSTGLINPIYKAKDKCDPHNYRKITLLNSLSKIFESILNNRLVFHNECLRLNDPFQNGFTQDGRTTDNAFILNGIAEKYRSQKRPVFVCFVDFKSAFDLVNRKALLYKLLNSGIKGKMFNILRDMFSKSNSRVKWNNEIGQSFENKYGVLQGGVISPNLFKVYMNDIHKYLGDDCGVEIGDMFLNYLLHADDLVLISETRSGLQKLLNRLAIFCKHWHLILNKDKTQFMVLNKKYDTFPKEININYNGNLIPETDTYKYLGFLFGHTVNPLKNHFQFVTKKAQRAIFQLKTYLRKALGSEMPYRLLLKLFDQQIKPILEYGSELWCPTRENDLIERTQLSYIKNIFGLNKHTPTLAVLGETGRFPLLLRQQDSQIKYWARIQQLPEGHPVKNTYKSLLIISKNGHDTWAGRVTHLLNNTVGKHFSDLLEADNYTDILKLSKEFRYNQYTDKYFENLNNSNIYPKLRTYKLLKKDYRIEPYILSLENKNYQRALFKLRASSHQLAIETGRHSKEYVPVERRLCEYCSTSQIDDECHFLTKCPFHLSLRNAMFKNILQAVPNCKLYASNPDIFIDLLTSKNKRVLSEVGKYVYNAFKSRNSILKSTVLS